MKYNIDLNDNDYIEFNYSYLKHSKIGKYSERCKSKHIKKHRH